MSARSSLSSYTAPLPPPPPPPSSSHAAGVRYAAGRAPPLPASLPRSDGQSRSPSTSPPFSPLADGADSYRASRPPAFEIAAPVFGYKPPPPPARPADAAPSWDDGQRRRCWLLLIAALGLLIIAAVVLGAVGGTGHLTSSSSRKSTSTPSSLSSSSAPPAPSLSYSSSSSGTAPSGPSLYTYPAPPAGVNISSRYHVLLSTNSSDPVNLSCYATTNPSVYGGQTSFSTQSYNAWLSFAFSGSVDVTIVSNVAFASARILPTPLNVVATTVTTGSSSSVSFTLTQPGQYVLDVCSTGSPCVEANVNLTYPVLIFADAISGLLPAPDSLSPAVFAPAPGVVTTLSLSGQQSTVYFGPGRYELADASFTLGTDQTAYLAAGAYVVGSFNASATATNFALVGQGVLSGEFVQICAQEPANVFCPTMFYSNGNAQCGFTLQGITFVNSPTHNTFLNCNGNEFNSISNVKMISWHATTDAIRVGSNLLVQSSFLKVGDDNVHLFANNMLMTNCVLWQGHNWGLFTEFGGNTNVSLANNYVVRTEWAITGNTANNAHDAVFSSFYTGNTSTTNINVTNLYVENSDSTLFKLTIQPAPGGGTLASWTDSHWSNITVVDPQAFSSLILSYNPLYTINITFDNVVVAGQSIDAQLNSAPRYYVNRPMSLEGNLLYQPFLRSLNAASRFQVLDLFTVTTLSQPSLNTSYVYQGLGEFHNDGYSSAVFLDLQTAQLGIWSHPFLNGAYYPIVDFSVPAGYSMQAVNDFNGDGISDCLLWSLQAQTGLVLLLTEGGASPLAVWTIVPTRTALNWAVQGAADMDANGCADVVLGNVNVDTDASTVHLEIIFLSPTGVLTTVDLTNSALTRSSPSGLFDSTWTVVAISDFTGNIFGCIVWWSAATQSLAISQFNGLPPTAGYASYYGAVFTSLQTGQQLVGAGDCNGDGAADLIVYDARTANYSIVYMAAWPAGPGLISDTKYAIEHNQYADLPNQPYNAQWWISSLSAPANFSASLEEHM